MIRPAELAAIKAGTIDLAFRRWARPRVVVGTRMRTGVGLIEVTSVEQVGMRPAGGGRAAGRGGVAGRAEAGARGPARRPGLAHRGGVRRTRPARGAAVDRPDADEIAAIVARLDRLDASSAHGPWTRATLDLIDLNPTVRAPDLAAQVGRETADFKKDVRKLKELGLTESLAIGYLLSPARRGGRRRRAAGAAGARAAGEGHAAAAQHRRAGDPRAARGRGDHAGAVAAYSAAQLAAMHGVGPIAIARLRDALAEQGSGLAGD